MEITWYKQEAEITNYIKQDGLPALDALTLCFRFKPLVIDNEDSQANKFLISISDPGILSQSNPKATVLLYLLAI